MLKTKSIYDIPLRVTYYARVSSESDEQLNSLDNQISYYVEWVNKYIDKILVTPEDDGSLRLDIKIFTGETTQKYLANLQSRTGHTFKKMIEAYEQGLQ